MDQAAYQTALEKRQYPELFRQMQFDCGGRKKLLEMLKALLVPKHSPGRIYDILTRWPFACYLTTNYDNEISNHLDRVGVHFVTLQNRLEDFHHIRSGASHVILKLHSDLDHPSEAIVTSADYKKLSTDTEGVYFREKLRTIFDMFDMVILGHSLSDFDLSLVLKIAQQTANPNRPIYMVATGLNSIEIREFYENFNIVVIAYDNPDGTHDQLRRLLNTADKFVPSRNARVDLPAPIDTQESEAATSMLIFRRLRAVQDHPHWDTAEYVGPLILQALSGTTRIESAEALLSFRPFASMLQVSDRQMVLDSIESARQELVNRRLLESTSSFELTGEGKELALDLKATRDLEKAQAYGQFATSLHRLFPGLDHKQQEQASTLIEQCLVESFRRRGLAIANSIFGDHTISAEDLAALFGAISRAAAHLDEPQLQLAFTEAAHEFLVEPTAPQQNYLTSLSQGFFLYHMLGYDAACATVRRDLFTKTVWFVDSSVLIPLLATGSHNHAYASDFFARLGKRGVRPFVTRRMAREVWEHLEWAARFVRENPSITPAFVAAALVKPGYNQNLFLDGFIRLSAERQVGSFDEYVQACGLDLTHGVVMERIAASGIRITDMSVLPGFQQDDWGEVRHLADMIKDDRAARGIYRSDEQVDADAEVLFIIQKFRSGGYRLESDIAKAYFVSQSHVLDRVSTEEYVTTWTPESVYRYLLSLPGELPNPALFQECMLHEYFQAGISVIDKTRYTRFFGPAIDASRVRFEEQKKQYLKDVERSFNSTSLDSSFRATPDLEKPLFVHRMTLRSVEMAQRLAREAIQRAEEAERKVKLLEQERAEKWRSADRARIRQREAEAKHLADPKHIKKRERQRKRKQRKK